LETITSKRSNRDLLNTLAAIADKSAGFRSLCDTWADTTTAHGRLMLTVLVGLAEFERELIRRYSGDETLAEIGRSYNVSGWTISRLITQKCRG
jgi:DNA-directed RNA polymerase specialized sigma subunit